MPRIAYCEYKPKGDTALLIDVIDGVLRDYSDAGYDLTLRQLYYQMIAKDLFPDSWIDPVYNRKNGLAPDTKNTVKSYKRLGDIVSKAREAGLLDWGHIVDRGRELEKPPAWDDPNDFLSSVAPQFRMDLWLNQPTRVEVWVEKDALSGVIGRACRPLNVPFFACKGYVSSSSIWEAAHGRMLQQYGAAGQAIVVIHLGDHDPSGIDMTRDIEERLRRFATPYNKKFKRPEITVQRIALNMNQVEEYTPPPNPAKESDPRAAKYVNEYGDDSWELDALDPPVIVDLVRDAIVEHLDEDLFDARKEQETEWRAQLVELAGNAEF
jgi:hypothetical protein